MINISSWSLQQIIHRFIIHICGADSGQFFPVLARRVCRNNAGTVKTIQRHNLNLFHLDNISRLHNNTAFFGNAPLHPCFHRFLWPDKRNWNLLAIFIRSHHPALDDVCCPFRRHVVLMIMGRKHCIDLFERKWINNKRDIAKVGLHLAPSAHICHLMPHLHLAVSMGSFPIAAPQIHCNIRVFRCLKPDSGTSKPPHGNISRRYHLIFNVFYQPGSPFRECTLNPAFSCHFAYLAHIHTSSDSYIFSYRRFILCCLSI